MANKKPGRPATNKVVKIEKKQKEKKIQEFDGFITKIAFKKETPEIHYKKDSEKSSKEVTVKAKEKPLDTFAEAMQDLKEFFVHICEIQNHIEETKIIGVSLSEKGVVITGQYELGNNGFKGMILINSPLVRFEKNPGGYEMSEDTKEKINKLKLEAIQYINGEYATKQQTLFEE